MIRNLRERRRKIRAGLAQTNLQFTTAFAGQRDLLTVARLILSGMAPLVEMQHGVFYITDIRSKRKHSELLASYALSWRNRSQPNSNSAKVLSGSARWKQKELSSPMFLPNTQINSGLGEAVRKTSSSAVLFEGQVKAVIELASFEPFSEIHFAFLDPVDRINRIRY